MPDINANLKNAHARAWSEVKEDDSLPNIDVGVLINFLVDMFKSNKKERVDIIKKYAKTYSKSFLRYGKIFSEDFFPKTINEILEKTDREEFRTLAENGFADCLVNASEEIIGIVVLYFRKKISPDEFLVRMSQTGIGEVGVKAMDSTLQKGQESYLADAVHQFWTRVDGWQGTGLPLPALEIICKLVHRF